MDVVVNGNTEEIPKGAISLVSQGYLPNIVHCLYSEAQNAPLADLLRRTHHLTGQWVIASPIYWEATHNDATIVATPPELPLTDEESMLWFAAVSELLHEDGFNPVYHNSGMWLFDVSNKPPLNSKAIRSLLNQSLMPHLATLDTTLYWQRLFTELQMFFSEHPLNKNREIPVNGLWFWGEGALQPPPQKSIVTDMQLLIEAFSINPIQDNTVFTKDSLVIIQDATHLEKIHLVKKLKKQTVNWYWNNTAYTTKSTHWWSRGR
ncbi:MAG: hypothetical protein WC785_07095 [Tatlockia sp.]|jgi:hypothetical protein